MISLTHISSDFYFSLLPSLTALVANKGWPTGIARWEVEGSVLRGGGTS